MYVYCIARPFSMQTSNFTLFCVYTLLSEGIRCKTVTKEHLRKEGGGMGVGSTLIGLILCTILTEKYVYELEQTKIVDN